MQPSGEETTIASARRNQLAETIGRLVLGITLVFLLGVFIAGWVGDRLVRRRLAAIAARGEPLTLPAVSPAPGVPGALPLYQQAVEKLHVSAQEKRRLKFDFRGKPLPESVLRANPMALDLCRRASRCARCNYPPDPAVPSVSLDNDGWLQVPCRLLRDAALCEAARGDTESALSDLRAIVRVSAHAGDIPGTMGLLRWIAFRTLAERAAGEILLTPRLNPSDIRQIGLAIPPVDWQQAGVDAIREERAVGLAIYDASIFRPTGTPGASVFSNRGSEVRALFRWDELAFLDAIDRSVRQIQKPFFRSGGSPPTPVARYAPLAPQIAPDGSRLRVTLERAIVRDREMRIAVALALYAHQHGTYPRTLDALTPGTDANDPYAGKPFRYRQSSQHYQLWSVGPNRKDEGGAHRKPQDDVVWPVPFQ